MLIPKVYYRVGEKASFKTEAAALLEAAALMEGAKQMVQERVYKCVAMRYDEISAEGEKKDCPEWRIDDVIELPAQVTVNWEF